LILNSLDGLTHPEILDQNWQLRQLVLLDPPSSCHVVISNAPNLQSLLYVGNLLNLSFTKEAPRLTQSGLMSSCFPTSLPLGLDWRELFLKISHIWDTSSECFFLVHQQDKSRWQSEHS